MLKLEVEVYDEPPKSWDNELRKSPIGHAYTTSSYGMYVRESLGWEPYYLYVTNKKGDLVSQLPDYMWMPAREVALQGYNAVMAGKTVHIPGRFNRGVALLVKLMPDRLARWLTRSQASKYRRTDPVD